MNAFLWGAIIFAACAVGSLIVGAIAGGRATVAEDKICCASMTVAGFCGFGVLAVVAGAIGLAAKAFT